MSVRTWFKQRLSDFLLKDIKPSRDFLCDFSRICQEVRPADVLLIEGRNRISRTIQSTTKSAWTHSALYIGRIHDIVDPKLREYVQSHFKGPATVQLLIESEVGKGTIIVPITKYQKEHIRVCRPSGLTYEDAQKVIQYTLDYIGTRYDVRHFLDLYRFLVASWFIPRTFRSSVLKKNLGRATEDICSSMIAKAFASVRFPILPLIRKSQSEDFEVIARNPNLYAPCDFDYSPYFEIIKYPMLPVYGFNIYRQLPWQEELISNDDQGLVPHSVYTHEEKRKP